MRVVGGNSPEVLERRKRALTRLARPSMFIVPMKLVLSVLTALCWYLQGGGEVQQEELGFEGSDLTLSGKQGKRGGRSDERDRERSAGIASERDRSAHLIHLDHERLHHVCAHELKIRMTAAGESQSKN